MDQATVPPALPPKRASAATDGRFQLSTDGLNTYADAVEYSFDSRVDYAQLVKEFGQEGGEEQRRYAPPRLIGAEKIKIQGEPVEEWICTSHVERSNWTLRGHLRRMTRLSNGFSRKRANLRAALALFFAYYNFCKFHKKHPHEPGDGGRDHAAPVVDRGPARGSPGGPAKRRREGVSTHYDPTTAVSQGPGGPTASQLPGVIDVWTEHT